MPNLLSIQYLRGFAALLVVYFHTAPPAAGLVGEAGVDIFFVISGFVMFLATANRDIAPATFLYHRIIRVVPLYWLFTLVLASATLIAPQAFPRLAFDGERILQSLAFIPHAEPLSGKILPFLVQGWTLNYEMFFYLLMALALFLPGRWRLAAVTVTLAGLGLVGALIGRATPAASVYLDPLLLEFAFGLWLGALYTRGWLPGRAAALGLTMVSAAVLIASAFQAETAEHYRLVAWGMSGAGLVYGLVALERAGGLPAWRVPALIGDSSYSLYLTHTFVISVMGKLVERLLADATLKTSAPVMAVTIVASVVVGIIVWRFIEMPMLSALRGRRSPQLKSATQRT